MKKSFIAAALISAFAAAPAFASTITLTGDYIKANVTDKGVLNSIIYDKNGNGVFDTNTDYVAPGTPFEAFAVSFNGTTYVNSNSGVTNIAGSTTAVGVNSALWSGGNSLFSLSHSFFLMSTNAESTYKPHLQHWLIRCLTYCLVAQWTLIQIHGNMELQAL